MSAPNKKAAPNKKSHPKKKPAPAKKAAPKHRFKDSVGSKAQVFHGTKSVTKDGLRKKDLMKTKGGRIVNRIGSRAQVFNGNRERTSGGLTKKDLMKNSRRRIVSIKARDKALKQYNENSQLRRILIQKQREMQDKWKKPGMLRKINRRLKDISGLRAE